MIKSKTGIEQLIFMVICVFCFAGLPYLVFAEDLNLVRIGSGGKTGVYYPIAKIIAQSITDSNITTSKNHHRGKYLSIVQHSGGSIDNVKSIIDGEIEAGLVQADVAAWAYGATDVFNGDLNYSQIRAVAGLYPEKFQIVIRKDAGINSMYNLRGKRIAMDEKGSGTLGVMRIILEAHGLTETDLKPVYLKPIFIHEKILAGDIQGFVMMAGTPMEAVSQLVDKGISLLSVTPDKAAWIEKKYPYLVPGKIEEGVYPGIPETQTIQVHALLVVHKKMDEELAYKLTAALWSQQTLNRLKKGHAQGKSITPGTALKGISIPIHPGAKKYYQEHTNQF